MIVDTTFLIGLLRNSPDAVRKASEIDVKKEPVFATTISVFELWQGVIDLQNKNKLDKIHILLDSIGLLTFDLESAKIAGRIHAQLRAEGLTIDPEDSMIAGICIKSDQAILTKNTKHFERIPELKLESY
ncbi:MAG: PIN domain-containing protein [Candidatus Aenigmarchaeota archaeon]|nr:PIN domain-containing protein [Candidatus Aenigmarchaeota archaeon]